MGPVFEVGLPAQVVGKIGTSLTLTVVTEKATKSFEWENPSSFSSIYSVQNEERRSILQIDSLRRQDDGEWSLVAFDSLGNSLKTFTHLRVEIPKNYKAPVFLETLQAFLSENGALWSLECKVFGIPTPSLKWFQDDHPIEIGETFELKKSQSFSLITCEASNVMGSSTSHVKLKQESQRMSQKEPFILQKLMSQNVILGDSYLLSISVDKKSLPLLISWFNGGTLIKNNSNNSKYNFKQQEGSGVFSLRVSELEWKDESDWCVLLKNEIGETSDSCKITQITPSNYVAPVFETDLVCKLSTTDFSVTFEFNVTGFPKPTLSWFVNGKEFQEEIPQILTNESSLYSVVARNCLGEAFSSSCVKRIQSEKKKDLFFQPLKNEKVLLGHSHKLQIQVSKKKVDVQWYKDGQYLSEKEDPIILLGTQFNNNIILAYCEINEIERKHQGLWEVQFKDELGNSESSSCYLDVEIPSTYSKPRFLSKLQATLNSDGTLNLECKVIGEPKPNLIWFKDGVELKSGDIHKLVSSSHCGNCSLGTYVCLANNIMGFSSSSASVFGSEETMQHGSLQITTSESTAAPTAATTEYQNKSFKREEETGSETMNESLSCYRRHLEDFDPEKTENEKIVNNKIKGSKLKSILRVKTGENKQSKKISLSSTQEKINQLLSASVKISVNILSSLWIKSEGSEKQSESFLDYTDNFWRDRSTEMMKCSPDSRASYQSLISSSCNLEKNSTDINKKFSSRESYNHKYSQSREKEREESQFSKNEDDKEKDEASIKEELLYNEDIFEVMKAKINDRTWKKDDETKKKKDKKRGKQECKKDHQTHWEIQGDFKDKKKEDKNVEEVCHKNQMKSETKYCLKPYKYIYICESKITENEIDYECLKDFIAIFVSSYKERATKKNWENEKKCLPISIEESSHSEIANVFEYNKALQEFLAFLTTESILYDIYNAFQSEILYFALQTVSDNEYKLSQVSIEAQGGKVYKTIYCKSEKYTDDLNDLQNEFSSKQLCDNKEYTFEYISLQNESYPDKIIEEYNSLNESIHYGKELSMKKPCQSEKQFIKYCDKDERLSKELCLENEIDEIDEFIQLESSSSISNQTLTKENSLVEDKSLNESFCNTDCELNQNTDRVHNKESLREDSHKSESKLRQSEKKNQSISFKENTSVLEEQNQKNTLEFDSLDSVSIDSTFRSPPSEINDIRANEEGIQFENKYVDINLTSFAPIQLCETKLNKTHNDYKDTNEKFKNYSYRNEDIYSKYSCVNMKPSLTFCQNDDIIDVKEMETYSFLPYSFLEEDSTACIDFENSKTKDFNYYQRKQLITIENKTKEREEEAKEREEEEEEEIEINQRKSSLSQISLDALTLFMKELSPERNYDTISTQSRIEKLSEELLRKKDNSLRIERSRSRSRSRAPSLQRVAEMKDEENYEACFYESSKELLETISEGSTVENDSKSFLISPLYEESNTQIESSSPQQNKELDKILYKTNYVQIGNALLPNKLHQVVLKSSSDYLSTIQIPMVEQLYMKPQVICCLNLPMRQVTEKSLFSLHYKSKPEQKDVIFEYIENNLKFITIDLNEFQKQIVQSLEPCKFKTNTHSQIIENENTFQDIENTFKFIEKIPIDFKTEIIECDEPLKSKRNKYQQMTKHQIRDETIENKFKFLEKDILEFQKQIFQRVEPCNPKPQVIKMNDLTFQYFETNSKFLEEEKNVNEFHQQELERKELFNSNKESNQPQCNNIMIFQIKENTLHLLQENFKALQKQIFENDEFNKYTERDIHQDIMNKILFQSNEKTFILSEEKPMVFINEEIYKIRERHDNKNEIHFQLNEVSSLLNEQNLQSQDSWSTSSRTPEKLFTAFKDKDQYIEGNVNRENEWSKNEINFDCEQGKSLQNKLGYRKSDKEKIHQSQSCRERRRKMKIQKVWDSSSEQNKNKDSNKKELHQSYEEQLVKSDKENQRKFLENELAFESQETNYEENQRKIFDKTLETKEKETSSSICKLNYKDEDGDIVTEVVLRLHSKPSKRVNQKTTNDFTNSHLDTTEFSSDYVYVRDVGNNWVSLFWKPGNLICRQEHTVFYKIESWLVGEGSFWSELGRSPLPLFIATHLKSGKAYYFRVTRATSSGVKESILTENKIFVISSSPSSSFSSKHFVSS